MAAQRRAPAAADAQRAPGSAARLAHVGGELVHQRGEASAFEDEGLRDLGLQERETQTCLKQRDEPRTTAGAFASSAGCVCRFRLRVFAIEARRGAAFSEAGPTAAGGPTWRPSSHARPGFGAQRPWRRPAASSCGPWRTHRHARCLLRATLTGCPLALTPLRTLLLPRTATQH